MFKLSNAPMLAVCGGILRESTSTLIRENSRLRAAKKARLPAFPVLPRGSPLRQRRY
jgi:hypothetical protein